MCNVSASNLIFTSTAKVLSYFDFGFVSQKNLSAHCLHIPPQKWYLIYLRTGIKRVKLGGNFAPSLLPLS